MHIYLIRHAEALPDREDKKRPLSQRGKEEARLVSNFLKKQSPAMAGEVWHSTRLRAKQTAEIFIKELAWNVPVKEITGLEPDDDIAEVVDRLNKAQTSIMIVGHMPFLGHLASSLVGRGSSNMFNFEPSAVLSLSHVLDRGGWVVQWMIGPSVIEG